MDTKHLILLLIMIMFGHPVTGQEISDEPSKEILKYAKILNEYSERPPLSG